MAHEVAHYYWINGSEAWLDEGPATIMEVIYSESRSPYLATDSEFHQDCEFADLQSLDDHGDDPPRGCVYSLGTRLFLDLYRTLGESDFQRGFKSLYVAGRDATSPESPDARGIDDLRKAFGFSSEATEEIIPKWYGE